jgi:hypothetical protein
LVALCSNPQPGGPGLHIYIPWRLGGPVIPQAPSTHFSRLLRHAWATVGLFFFPVTTRGNHITVVLKMPVNNSNLSFCSETRQFACRTFQKVQNYKYSLLQKLSEQPETIQLISKCPGVTKREILSSPSQLSTGRTN